MSDSNSTTPAPISKPDKPYPEFPLFAHATKRWAKKIRGKLHYFGPWSDPEGSLKNYLSQKDDLHAGRTPRPDAEAMTVKQVVNKFLIYKKDRRDSGELSPRTWVDYKDACDEIIAAFGKTRLVTDLRPEDFGKLRKRMAAKWGPHRLGKTIQFVRSVFKYAYDMEMIGRPIRFGPEFKSPSKDVMRRHKAAAGPQLFTANEIRRMIGAATPSMRAMILLGINCGMGNSDCAHLPLWAVDLAKDTIDFPRPKTGIARRCPLWPETVAALRAVLDSRPSPKNKEDDALVFLTRHGENWTEDKGDRPITKEMGKLLNRLGINGRKRLGFYTLRHCFRTVADESKDQPAVDTIMGHVDASMAGHYRERISDERLRAVSDYVRNWLFPSAAHIESVK